MSRNAILFVLLFSVSLSGCTSSASIVDQRAQRFAHSDAPISVAIVWPFSSGGTLFWEGVQFAHDEIMARGGINGRSLRLLKLDDHASVTEGMAVAQMVAGNPEVLAVIGHRNSYVALPAADVYDKAGLLYIAPSATNPDLTRQGYKQTFRTIPSDTEIGRQMAEYAQSQGFRRMVIVYSDDAYGRGLAASFEDHAESLGVRIVDRVSHYSDLQGARQTVAKWEALEYDGILVSDVLPGAAEYISLFRQAGADVPIIGGDGLDGSQLFDLPNDIVQGIVVGSVFDSTDPDPAVQRFVKEFEQRYGQTPDAWAAQGYDALHLLAHALSQAARVTPSAVADVLHRMEHWRGVTGVHSFDETGEVVGKPVVRKVVIDGRFFFQSK